MKKMTAEEALRILTNAAQLALMPADAHVLCQQAQRVLQLALSELVERRKEPAQ